MSITWTVKNGRIWATFTDGRSIPTWIAAPSFGRLVELLNTNPSLSALLLSAWLGEL